MIFYMKPLYGLNQVYCYQLGVINFFPNSFYNCKNKFYFNTMTEVKRSQSVHNFQQRCQQSNKKCICEICTCGKHRCPHPHIPFNGETTNHHDYKAYQVTAERSQRCAYKLSDSHYDPDLLKSTYRVNYKPFQCPAAQVHQKYAYQPNNAKFYDSTEYKEKYVPSKIVVEGPTPCQNQYRPSTGRFEGKTTYGQQFKAKRAEQDVPRQHYAYQKNNAPFYAQTTYGQTFQPYQINVQRPHTACQGRYTANNARFEAKSSYTDFYKAPHVERQCRCLIQDLPQGPRQCSPGKTHVHFDANHKKWN